MLAEDSPKPPHTLSLHSRLAEVAKLWPWVDALGVEYSVPADTLFAIHLCLEEALSNIIRHGYHGQPGQPIAIDFTAETGTDLVFTIDDQAPTFDPLAYEVSGKTGSATDLPGAGGHGIRFLRKYSDGLGYRRMADGNRLTIRFSIRR